MKTGPIAAVPLAQLLHDVGAEFFVGAFIGERGEIIYVSIPRDFSREMPPQDVRALLLFAAAATEGITPENSEAVLQDFKP